MSKGTSGAVEALALKKINAVLPSDMAGDPGLTLKFVFTLNFGEAYSTSIQEIFDVSRQTAWLWCRPQKGIPAAKASQLSEMVTTDPHSTVGLWLPTGVTVSDLLRKGSLEGRPPFSNRNQYLLHLLCEIVSGKHEGLGLATLDAFVSSHLPQLGSPHRVWQWAYVQGGIPESYVQQALRGMMHHGFYKALEVERGIGSEQFADYLHQRLASPARRNAKPVSDARKKTSRKPKKRLSMTFS